MRSDLPRGTVTFLFTDVEGSTRLLHALGPERYEHVLAEHLRVLRSSVSAHGGREVDTQGDSLFAAFPRAKDAVAAAVEAQRGLAASTAGGIEVKVRMGVHTGEPIVGDERYVGMGVHKAARIGAAGHGGQVLLSRTTRELVEDELPEGVTLRDLGARRLKDVERPEELYQLEIFGLQSDFPRLQTVDIDLRRTRRRRAFFVAAVLGLAAVALAAFVLVGRGGGGAVVAPNSVAIVDVRSNTVVGAVPVGVRPRAIAVGDGIVLVANTEDQTVSRIDVGERRVVRTIALGEFPSDVTVGDGSAWVALGGAVPAKLTRIALDQNEPDPPIVAVLPPIDGGSIIYSACSSQWASLALGGGAIWFVCNNGTDWFWLTEASRVHPSSGQLLRLEDALSSSSPQGVALSDVAFGNATVWFANLVANAVIEFEPATNLRVREVAVGSKPEALVVGFGSVWTANAEGNSVTRVTVESPQQPAAVQSISVGSQPSDVVVGDDAVWVVNRGDGTLSRIDPTTNEVVATVRLGHQPMRAAVSGGLVWVTIQVQAHEVAS